MATKTYLPAIQRRIFVRPNTVFGIVNYDVDNAYPQRVLEWVRQSPTGKSCWEKRAKFLGGNGFEEPKLGKVIINNNGLTLAKLLHAIKTDKALFPGYGLHVNYNANFQKTSVNFVKYEDIRQGDTESEKYRGKYVVYKDWGRRTWRSIYQSKLQVIDAYNPDPEVIKQQVIEAGGWENYKGQLFYLTPVVDDYELCIFDAAYEDLETEAGIKIFNNRQVETGFMPSAILSMKARREDADEEGPQPNGMLGYVNKPTQLEENLSTFQGAKNAQKIIVLEYEDSEDKPELLKFDIQNNDKLFESTEKSVEGRIIKGFNMPKELIQAGDKQGLNASGAEKREAIREFNDTTAPERLEISEVLAEIFDNFIYEVNPSGNWTITEVTTEGMGPDVIRYAANIQTILESTKLTKENKIAILVNTYGYKKVEAIAMIPEDDFVKAATEAAMPKKEIKPGDPAQADKPITQEAA